MRDDGIRVPYGILDIFQLVRLCVDEPYYAGTLNAQWGLLDFAGKEV